LNTATQDETKSLGTWLRERRYSRAFIDLHIVPMTAAIWSTPARDTLDYPVAAFARFFANHGLLQVRNRPQWRTVRGGSRAYVKRITEQIGSVQRGLGVTQVRRNTDAADLTLADGSIRRFDHVVLACHADDSLRLLSEPTSEERRLLGSFRYQPNTAVLHRDPTFMPKRRRLWSSWNYVGHAQQSQLCVSYWMNALQPLPTDTPYFVTLNPQQPIAKCDSAASFQYAHPVFDSAAIAAQRQLWRLQGQQRTWFAGSYFGSGFHEDGVQSGLAVAEDLGGVRRPWTVDDESGRIHRRPVEHALQVQA
jgi:uncharacterized protein